MKFLRKIKLSLNNEETLPVVFLLILGLIFFWKFFLKGLIPVPSDVITGIYYPWRDYVWPGFPAGVPIKNGLLSDVVSIIYPWRILGMDLFKNGIFPLWITNTLGGAPLLANFQSALLSPFNLLFFLFSNIDAWTIYIIFQPVLASIFTYIFLRSLGLKRFSSIFGGIIFAYSGFMMVWLEYGILGHAGLWLPLILYCINKMSSLNPKKWVITAGFLIMISFFSGYPQITVYSLVISFFYCLFQCWRSKSKVYLLFLISLLLGITLSMIQLLPGAELLKYSIRQSDPTTASFSSGIIPIKHLLLGVIPDYFGNPVTGNWRGWASYNESAFYVGFLGLFFAILGFVSFGKKNSFVFFKFLLILSLALAFDTFFAHFFHNLNIPGLASASSGRFLFIVDFCLAVIAGYGFEEFVNNYRHKKIIIIIVLMTILFGILWYLTFKFSLTDPEFLVSKRNLIVPTIFFVTTIVICFVRNVLIRVHVGLLVSVMILLLIFDVFKFGWKYNPFSRQEFLYPNTEFTDFLKNNLGSNRFAGLLPQSMWRPYNLNSSDGYDAMMIKRYSEFINQLNNPKTEIPTSGSRWVKIRNYESPLFNLIAIKYFANYKEDVSTGWDPEYYKYSKNQFKLVFQKGKSQIYENNLSFPRTFISHDFVVLNDNLLSRLSSNQYDLRKTIFFEEQPPMITKGEIDKADSSIIINDNTNGNLTSIKSKSQEDGYLFLSDVYYPGWKAYIDNIETKIYRADYTFRAVFLPKGEHTVDFVYNPISFKIGAAISLAALTIVILIGFIPLKNK